MSYIKGIDVSNNDGSIDFSKVANDGVEYVYLKATEGQSFKDNTMEVFYNDCKSNNIKLGAYHFLVGTSTPEDQAQNFYTKIKDYDWDLVPMMDIETNFDGLSDYVVRFINAFKQLSPLQLGIYSYTSFIDYISDIAEAIKDFPFWEANYGVSECNLPSNFFTTRIGHQYSETGTISGINCNCDVNSFTEGVLLNNSTIAGQWIEGIGDDVGKWWYKHKDESYTKDGWEKVEDKWYYFNDEGWMVYDWKKDGNSWYFLGDSNDGSMKIGWFLQDSKWYYFNQDGVMLTGWQKINEKWYFFDKIGTMKTGWVNVDNKGYCLYSSGEMIHDTIAYGYSFNSNGQATKL